jgi:hypothetical protein
MVRSTFDWSLWIIVVCDGLAYPHSWIPYVQIGFKMHLYINVLFSRESLDFRPKSHDIEAKILTVTTMNNCLFHSTSRRSNKNT